MDAKHVALRHGQIFAALASIPVGKEPTFATKWIIAAGGGKWQQLRPKDITDIHDCPLLNRR